jgi:hypothetical protein
VSQPRDPALAPALAVVGGALASILPGWAHVPVALYDPVARTWRLGQLGSTAPGMPAIEITYYGVYAWALVGALVGALAGLLLERRALSARLPSAWALTALGLALSYHVWSIWP